MTDDLGPLPHRRLLVTLGGAIIVAMLLVAAFSLGVFFGETKSGNRPSLAGMLGVPQAPVKDKPAAAPVGGATDLPGTQPTVVGAVLATTPGAVTIRTANGPRTLTVDDSTTIRHPGGRPATVADLVRDTKVAVFGAAEGDGLEVRARLVVILP